MIQSLINTVIQGDCLDVMKSMPDKCIDLVLTDPPYGNKAIFNGSADYANRYLQYDNSEIKQEYIDEIFRISKNQIIWGGNYFILPPSRGWVIWDKDRAIKNYSGYELAFTSFDKNIEYIKICNNAGFILKPEDKKVHPSQKPIKLFQILLQNYSQPDMTIFDPFAGSGTTAIACLETGRNYILVEKEPDYVEIINKRIDTWKEQGRLFPAHVI